MASDYTPYGDGEPRALDTSIDHSVSRRNLLKQGAAAVVGSAAILSAGPADAQQAQQPGVAPRPAGSLPSRKYRALVRHSTRLEVQELTLRPIQPRQVVLRVQAAQACYSIVNALNTANPPMVAAVVGHGGVGIVEEVGPMVKRVQVGDRVVVPVTAQCGECYNCLHGNADRCQSGVNRPVVPVANMADGTAVNGNLGAFAELMVAWEEQCVPIFSTHNAAELSLLSCVATTGLGMAMMRVPVEPGSHVVVFGAGPVGLSAVQGARLQGAAKIVVVEPIRSRRDLAVKLGATAVVDPNAAGDMLVATLRDLTKGVTNRPFAGGRGPNADGPDFIIEAVGGDRFPPKMERGPDPTGVQVLQQAWQLCPPGGWIRTSGVGHPMGSTVTFPAGAWSNGTKNQAGGNFAGVQTLRDIPRFVRLIETGQFDARSLATSVFSLERAREALQAAADRTTVAAVVTMDPT